ncbi:MAG: outer membrane beta-barrel protein [Bacteroidia bacterium]
MKYKIVFIIVLSLLSNRIISQTNENVNPKGKWYFGGEMGLNKITSFSNGKSQNSLQGGILSEYYFAKHWSLSGRIKYYKTGVSFYRPDTHSGSIYDLGSDETSGTFNGEIISIPFDLKWEFRIYKNLGGSLKLGYAYNFETKSNYSNYSPNLKTGYAKHYEGFNAGCGLNYFINKNMAVYLDIEYYRGASKGYTEGLLWKTEYFTENNLINFGIKYNFKKEKEIK